MKMYEKRNATKNMDGKRKENPSKNLDFVSKGGKEDAGEIRCEYPGEGQRYESLQTTSAFQEENKGED